MSSVACFKVGVLMLNTRFPRLTGDIGNPDSLPCEVIIRRVDAARVDNVVGSDAPEAALQQTLLEAGDELQAQGIDLLVTSCGFLSCMQDTLAARYQVPVIASSLVLMPVPPTDHKRIDGNDKVDLVTMPGTRIITFQMNQNRVEALKDVRVRQAIVHAINNEGIVKKIMRGFATPAAQMSPEGYLGYNPDLKPRYDLKKAKALMKEAGYEDGLTLTMMAPNNRYVNDEKIAQAVVSMLAKVGITVDLKTMPKAQYWPTFDERAADIMMIGWHADTEDSNNFYEFLSACPDADSGLGQYNSGNYCNPEADKLMMQANVETDPAKRAELMQQIEQMLYDDAAFIPLHWQNLAWASAKGVEIEPVVNKMNFPYLGDLVIKR